MTLPNHIAGGIVVTSVFSSIIGINVVADFRLCIVVLVASMLPDIDHPSTLIGRLLSPLSKYISDHFGHRTLTHSLLFVFVAALLVSFFNLFLEIEHLVFVFTLALFVHLLLDMMTISGIEFLYPFSKTIFVMPEREELRFSTNSKSTEVGIFGFFLLAGMLMWPLMANGFWTTYNRSMGTVKHLKSEFVRTTDLLFVKFEVQNGSKIYEVEGYVLDINGDDVVLLVEGNRLVLPRNRERIVSVFPSHSGVRFEYKTEVLDSIDFVGIDQRRVLEVQKVDSSYKVLWVDFDVLALTY